MAVHHNYCWVLLQMIILLLWPIQTSSKLPSCSYKCGNATIRYPFGITEGCYFNKSFEVFCSTDSSGDQKAFLTSLNNLELRQIDIYYGVSVNIPVISLHGSETTSNAKGIDLSSSPFIFPWQENRLAIIGCDNYSTINNSTVFDSGQCLSICTCDPTDHNSGCYDFLCAPKNISKVFNADILHIYPLGILQQCRSVSMVQEQWILSNYLKNPNILKEKIEQIPAVLKWGEYKGSCFKEYNTNYTCNLDGRCLIQLSSSYVCVCDESSDLVRDGYCSGDLICKTDHNCSSCPSGYYYSAYSPYCYRRYDIFFEKSRLKLIIIGCTAGGFGLLFLLIGIWRLYKFLKRRRKIKLKKKFFKRNGGLLLRQELSSNESNIEKTKLFTSKELEKATDKYNANRILGQGGQGTVYKGMLEDGKIVAVKKSKVVDESNLEQFINEVVILSQINHRNVVKLFGCCLETEVPLLVYEFIPNGTLFQHIHDQKEEFPLTWEMRLRIAVEVSCALCYLHSAASIPIYHRDIKSANILLDDKYRAKVSDFGTSRSIAIDQTHLTTQVHGTFGYVDPEYFLSSQFTEKSDVYSFGVVLVELLTGQKPIRNSVNSEEYRSLASYFLQAMKDNHLFEILDGRVLKEAEKEEIITVAMLAKRCLNHNGKKRPTMIEVAVELGGLRGSNVPFLTQQNIEEIDFVNGDITDPFETYSPSTGSVLNSVAFSLDVNPLISEKV